MHENVRLPFTKFVYRINKYTFAISYDINNNKKQNKKHCSSDFEFAQHVSHAYDRITTFHK